MESLTRAMRKGGLMVVAMVIACGSAQAQTTHEDPAVTRLRAKLKPRDTITVQMQDGERIRGRYLTAASGEVLIATDGGDRRLAASGIDRVKQHKVGVFLGGLIGGGIGVACGAAAGALASNEGGSAGAAFLGLTALGVGVGVLVDAAFNVPRTVYKRGSTQASVAIAPRPRGAAVGLTIAF
jgi:hypothetical protein